MEQGDSASIINMADKQHVTNMSFRWKNTPSLESRRSKQTNKKKKSISVKLAG